MVQLDGSGDSTDDSQTTSSDISGIFGDPAGDGGDTSTSDDSPEPEPDGDSGGGSSFDPSEHLDEGDTGGTTTEPSPPDAGGFGEELGGDPAGDADRTTDTDGPDRTDAQPPGAGPETIEEPEPPTPTQGIEESGATADAERQAQEFEQQILDENPNLTEEDVAISLVGTDEGVVLRPEFTEGAESRVQDRVITTRRELVRSSQEDAEVREAIEGVGGADLLEPTRTGRREALSDLRESIQDDIEGRVGTARAGALGVTNPRLRRAVVEGVDVGRDDLQVTRTSTGAEVTLAPDFEAEVQQELEDIAAGRITASLAAQTGADLERGEGVEIVDRDGVLFGELTRQGRKQVAVERSELVGPTEGTPAEGVARAGAGVGFEFQEFRRQRRETFFETLDEGVAEGLESIAGIQVRSQPDDEFTTVGAIAGDFRQSIEEQFGDLGPVRVRAGPGEEFITIEEAVGGAAQVGAGAFNRAFPDVDDPVVQDPITAAETVAGDFAEAADAAFPGVDDPLITAPFQAGSDIFEEFGPPTGRAIDRAFPDADDPLIQDPIEAGGQLATDSEEFLADIDTQQTGTRLVAAGAVGFAGPQLVEPTSTAIGAGAVLVGGAILAGGAVLEAERATRPDEFEAPTVTRPRPEFEAPVLALPGGLPGDIAQPEEGEPFLGPEVPEVPESVFISELDVPLGRPTLQEIPVGEQLLPQPLTLELPDETGDTALGQSEVPIDIEDGEVEVGPAGAATSGEVIERQRPQPTVPADPMGETVVGGETLEEATRRIEQARQREEQRARRQQGLEAGEGLVAQRAEEELLEETRRRQATATESLTQPSAQESPFPTLGPAADQVGQQFEELVGTRFSPATATMQINQPAMAFDFPGLQAQRFETQFPNLEAHRFETVFEFAPADVGFDTPATRLQLPDLPDTDPREDGDRTEFGLFGRRTEVLPGDPDAVLEDFDKADAGLDDLLREL